VDDERLVGDLRREYGLTLPVIAMYDLSPAEIHRHYRRAALVVGMRGHASMIPFGCGTPIISLISHPKLRYFLDDIDRPQWGVSVRDPHLAGRLRELTTTLLDAGPAVAADIAGLRRRLADVTRQNLRSLPPSLSRSRRLGQDEKGE
jgi:polysaccharide pyruvyl transferase WcaK-like protein